MKFPRRIKQHKSESDSFAILLYKLKGLGIFRNVTSNDYGIDLELEFVENEMVFGNYIKIQVKSTQKVKIRKKDGVPTFGGIKQSTLCYWTELSYKTHVLVYCVDLATEKIYLTAPIFWQATSLLDESNKKKTIEFVPIPKDANELLVPFLTKVWATSPRISDIIHMHKLSLRNLKDFLDLYADCFHLDPWTEIEKPEVFQSFLDACRILLWAEDLQDYENDKLALNVEDFNSKYSFQYWVKKTGEWAFDEIHYLAIQNLLKFLYPRFIEKLSSLKNKVLKAKNYWRNKDKYYLKLVYDVEIISELNHENIWDWAENYHQEKKYDFYSFLND